jgi:hypothetical protein
MSIRLTLAAAAVLALAPAALAQQAPAAPPAPAAAPAAPAAPSADQQAAVARIEAAGNAIEAVMTDLEPKAEEIREDTTLSAADKETRIRALIAEHQPVFDEFSAALGSVMALKAASEGASAEEAAAATQAAQTMVSQAIVRSLLTGDTEDGSQGE